MAFSNGAQRPFSLVVMALILPIIISVESRHFDFSADLLSGSTTGQSCEKIDKDGICGEQPYKLTTFPNLLKQDATEAKMALDGYRLLLQNNCSEHLHFFLCSVYMPMCDVVPPTATEVVVIPPCRTLCLAVQNKCESILQQFGYRWPEALACDQFPERNIGSSMCMPGPIDEPDVIEMPHESIDTTASPEVRQDEEVVSPCNEGSIRVNATGQCISSCDSRLIPEADKEFAQYFHSILAVSIWLLAVIAFIIHSRSAVRLSEAEKPVFCIILSTLMMAAGYMVRLAGGREMGCTAEGALITNDLVPGCAVVFCLLYYFGLAGHAWWLILSVTWFQEAVLKKGKKVIKRTMKRAYVIGWILPLFPTVAVLVAKLVDSDPITTLCFVGQQNGSNLLIFVLVPLIFIVAIGSCILVTGYCRLQEKPSKSALVAIQKPTETSETDSHQLAICILMYLPSAVVVIGCYFYDFATKELQGNRPMIVVYGLRVFCSFAYGIFVCGWLIYKSRTQRDPLPQKQAGYYPNNLMSRSLKDDVTIYRGGNSAGSSAAKEHFYSTVGPVSPMTFHTNLTKETQLKQHFFAGRKPASSSDSNPETLV